MAASLSRPGPAALKGVVVAVSTTALAVSAAAAYYGRRGWALPDNDEGLYRAFLDLMVGFATSDQPSGAVALLCTAALAAVLSGALAGRYAARVAGSKTERRRRTARVALLRYVASALGIPLALGLVNAILRSVRERCGSPTDLGVEQNRFTWAVAAPRTCDVAVDAYNELLVLYNCRDEVAGVELFAARGIHRIFKDDFEAGHRTMEQQR